MQGEDDNDTIAHARSYSTGWLVFKVAIIGTLLGLILAWCLN